LKEPFVPLVPLAIQKTLRRRPLVSAVIGFVVFYQALLAAQYGAIRVPAESLMERPFGDLGLQADFLLSLFCGAGTFSAIVLLLFWILGGTLLEDRIGRWGIALLFLAGAVIPFVIARAGLIAWERNYWPGLGGTMACMGAAYYLIWEDEIQTFYLSPMPLRAGITNLPIIFLLILLHPVLSLTQYVSYNARRGEVPPESLSTSWWVFLIPFAVLLVFLVFKRVRRALLPQAEEARA
jgi:hypothetical protein